MQCSLSPPGFVAGCYMRDVMMATLTRKEQQQLTSSVIQDIPTRKRKKKKKKLGTCSCGSYLQARMIFKGAKVSSEIHCGYVG